MINKIKEVLYVYGYEHIVITKDDTRCVKGQHIYIVKDTRSAVFFALGMYKEGVKKIAVVFEEDFLSSAYTAITECWFQRIPILLVAYNSVDSNGIDYLKRCIDKINSVKKISELEETVVGWNDIKSPALIRLQEYVEFKTFDYSSILDVFIRKFKGKIFVYNANQKLDIPNICYMQASHMYGVLSKYVGYNYHNPAILCIPEEYLSLDINVFNIRYIRKGFKVVVLGNTGIPSFFDWATNNKISIVETTQNNIQEHCDSFLNAECPTILYIK